MRVEVMARIVMPDGTDVIAESARSTMTGTQVTRDFDDHADAAAAFAAEIGAAGAAAERLTGEVRDDLMSQVVGWTGSVQ